MEAVGLFRRARSLAAIVVAVCLVANGQGVKSWSNLDSVSPGQALEVRDVLGNSVRGNYAARSEESIDLSVDQKSVSIARVQISEIRLRTRTQKAMWIGLGVGAAAGVGVGAGIGARFEQSGDFPNASLAATAIFAAVGALVGLGVGSTLAHRHAVVYRAK